MKILACIIFILALVNINAQETLKSYYDDEKSQVKSEHEITKQGNGNMYHGMFKEYFEDGKIKISGTYALGQLHGDYSEFSNEEMVLLKCRYTNGVLNGEHKIFYPSGNIKERRLFINGKLQGDRKFYSDVVDGEPEKIEKYQMGVKL